MISVLVAILVVTLLLPGLALLFAVVLRFLFRGGPPAAAPPPAPPPDDADG